MYDKVDQVTGVYTTNTTEAVHYQLKHSMTNIAVVDGRAQLEKVDVGRMIDNHDHVEAGWQNLAAFRREQKWQLKFSSNAYLQFSRQMRHFCV